MRAVNSIVFRKDEYEDLFAYENAISDSVKILLDAGYILTVRVDDKEYGITCVDFDFADTKFEGMYPVWLTPAEREELFAKRLRELKLHE